MKTRRFPLFYAEPDDAGGGTATLDGPMEVKPSENPFIKAFTTDPDKPAAPAPEKPAPVEKKSDPPPAEKPKSKVPDQLFAKPKDETKTDAKSERKSALDDLREPTEEKQKAQWREVKAKGHEFEKKVWELEEKIKDYETRGKDTEALQGKLSALEAEKAAAEAKVNEWSALVERVNAEAHPDFRRKYVDGRMELVKRAQELVRDNGSDPAAIETALALKGKPRIDALKEIAEEMPGYQQGILGSLIQQLDSLDAEAAQKRANAGEYWKEKEAEDRQRQAQEREKFSAEVNRTFEKVKRKLAAELEVLQPVDGFDEWNERGKTILAEAEQFFKNNDSLEAAAEAAIRERAVPLYRGLYIDEREKREGAEARVKELEAELEKVHSGGPQLRGGGGGGGDGKSRSLDPMERIRQETGLTR